jgi:radical SAM protein with 4Fe4S-binding SPASM domain
MENLRKETALKVIRELKPEKILFTGGEVYLAFHTLLEILKQIRTENFSYIFSSNMPLISKSEIDMLIEDYGIRVFHSSFNDLDDNMSMTIRNASPFQRKAIIASLEHIVKRNCELKVETIILPQTINKLTEINELLFDLGVKHHKIEFLIPIGNASTDLLVPIPEIEEAIMRLYANKKNDAKIEMTCYYLSPCLNSANRIFSIPSDDKSFIYNKCVDGIETCYLLSNGSLVPCFLFPDNIYDTNVIEKNSLDIWNHHELFVDFRKENSDCSNCDHFYYNALKQGNKKCNNGCRVLNYLNTKAFGSKVHSFY